MHVTFDPPLQSATLVRRYKRFLADVITDQGEHLTLHCPNTGAMTGCATPGDTVWYSTSINPKRKYRHTWELTETQNGEIICVNTLQANNLVQNALIGNAIPEFTGYTTIRREVKYGEEGSRIDFMLQADNKVNCYIEVKSVTLSVQERGFFPDAVSLRGQKHLRELMSVVKRKERAVLLFMVLHSAISSVSPATHIDPHYAYLLAEAQQAGVEIIVKSATMSNEGLMFTSTLSFYL